MSQIVVQVETASKKLAIHFNEDPSKFVLIECFTIFSDLMDKIAAARKENDLRHKQEERKAKLAAEKEQQLKDGPTMKVGTKKPVQESDDCVVDRLLSEIRRGEFKLSKTKEI